MIKIIKFHLRNLDNNVTVQHINHYTMGSLIPIAGGDKEIYSFPKGISMKWKVSSLIQDLNSGCKFHFLHW